jgi:NADH-quinone oxidoreductase subunit N
LWAPDAYQGAPAPAASLVAAASKVAAVAMFLNFFATGLAGPQAGFGGGLLPLAAGWVPGMLVVAALSMLLGNLVALAQRSVRRLLAYSSIAHAGYLLVGFASAGAGHVPADALLYYIATYAAATCGAFGVVAVVERLTGSDDLDAFAGLGKRSPALAGLLAVFLLSLAGIPPLAGFFAKFQLFFEALHAGGTVWTWIVALAIATSCISLYYYLQVLKRVFVVESDPTAAPLQPAAVSTWLVLGLLAAVVIAAGVWPAAVVGFAGE